MMKVGVHCSVRNGFSSALQVAHRLGCETVQIFSQNPRGWRTRVYTEEDFSSFRKTREETGLSPIVIHSPYLPNLCSSDPDLYKKSVDILRSDLERCEKLGADFLVIHAGAYSPAATYEMGLSQLTKALNSVLSSSKGSSRILIENVAGGGRRIGGLFKELSDILKGVQNSTRIGICFDTCHATGAGYDISTQGSVKAVLEEFDAVVGLKNIFVFHVNDSEGALGSHLDLHQHLGQGFVGLEGFKNIFKNPAFANCALILETPRDTLQDDATNLKILRSCLPAGIHA